MTAPGHEVCPVDRADVEGRVRAAIRVFDAGVDEAVAPRWRDAIADAVRDVHRHRLLAGVCVALLALTAWLLPGMWKLIPLGVLVVIGYAAASSAASTWSPSMATSGASAAMAPNAWACARRGRCPVRCTWCSRTRARSWSPSGPGDGWGCGAPTPA